MSKNKLTITILIMLSLIFGTKAIHNALYLATLRNKSNVIKSKNTAEKPIKQLQQLGPITIQKNTYTIHTNKPFNKTAEALYFLLQKTNLPIKKITILPKKNILILEVIPNV